MTFIDLSHTIEDGTITYPGLPAPKISDFLSWDASHATYASGVEFQIGQIELVANTGTYIDTPAHRYRDGFDLSALQLETVADVSGIVFDASGAVDESIVDGADLSGKAVLFRTGWDRHWATPAYGSPDHPFLSASLAATLVEAGARIVGIDSVNIDDSSPGAQGRRPVHSALLAAGIPVVEHLCNLGRLGSGPFSFFAVPVKVKGMATFPVRAFAITA
jgi:kynurenine formamidase